METGIPITPTTEPTPRPLPLLWNCLGEDRNQCSVIGAVGREHIYKDYATPLTFQLGRETVAFPQSNIHSSEKPSTTAQVEHQ